MNAPAMIADPIMDDLAKALRDVTARLREAGIGTASLDARLLLLQATGLTHEQLVADPHRPLDAPARTTLEALCARREAHAPVAHLLGEKEFWGLAFSVGPETLVPRPDSETVVEAALECADRLGGRERALRLLDLGTGSGCLAVALLSELPVAAAVAVDRSEAALTFAASNARRHGVAGRCGFVCIDWLDALAGRFDLIVSNPPYIATRELPGLMREVADHEPRAALDGGADGLDAYRRILPAAARCLTPGGFVVLEIGEEQAEAVAALARDAGLHFDHGLDPAPRDLSGTKRCLRATLGKQVTTNPN